LLHLTGEPTGRIGRPPGSAAAGWETELDAETKAAVLEPASGERLLLVTDDSGVPDNLSPSDAGYNAARTGD
jgi:hypothetical protein